MRALLLLTVLAAAARGERVRVAAVIDRPVCFLGERVLVRVRLSIEKELAEKELVQMFQRPFDLPVAVRAPWLKGLPAPAAGASGERVGLVLNDAPDEAVRLEPETRDGRRYLRFEIVRVFSADEPGAVSFAAPTVRYVHASEFREDLVHGRTAVDQKPASANGEPLAFEVRALPQAERPANFGGAVGRFTVRATADRRELKAGETLKVSLTIEGAGNFDAFASPSLDGLDGFHVYGALERRETDRRSVTFEVAPLHGDVKEVPAIPFAFFDPEHARYSTVTTATLPLAVHGDPAPSRAPGATRTKSSRGVLYAALAGIAVLGSLVLLALRRRAHAPEPTAADRFREQAAHAGADIEAIFAEFLAARLGTPAAAVIGPDLARRLSASGLPDELASRTAGFLERLVGARYGGTATADGKTRAEAVQLVNEISGCRRA